MCGIAGYFSKNEEHALALHLEKSIQTLSKRGPDLQRIEILSPQIGFAHARLSIIDTTSVANQPMQDETGRYTIVFNGEIFNFRELRNKFLQHVTFHSTSDTEVLLNLYILLGKECLNHLNGFFAFAVYDRQTQQIFLARDRYGIKPLLIYCDEEKIVFASELKALLSFPIKKEIDFTTLTHYLQLNYVPGSSSMLKNVEKLKPAHYAVIEPNGFFSTHRYYTIPYQPGEKIVATEKNYDQSVSHLRKLVEEAVERRLVADVPLGSFLSGGVDSSIVTACASKKVSKLNTFSVGYKDEPYFDETNYANLVAKKFNTNHTVFSVSNDEMFENIFSVLDYIDEPFADSSAIAVYILSKKTRQRVTVALSGDGGDELFAGYNKHRAEWQVQNNRLLNWFIKNSAPLFALLPQSRHSKFSNLFRQLNRYSEGLKMTAAERYWRWCTFQTESEALKILREDKTGNAEDLLAHKKFVLDLVTKHGDINDILLADTQMVLPNDMLTKVDLMSMANSLEVRVPLLDYTVVNFAFSLPAAFKIDAQNGKRILKDAFRDVLPAEIFNRPKHGFEVPLLKWLQTGLHELIETDLLSKKFVEEQRIFNYEQVNALKQKLFSANPGDVHATVWSLVVFQYWYKKYFLQ